MRISDWSSDVCSSDLVIITENGDRLLALDRIGQPLRRLVHVAENGRIGHEAANGRHPMALQLLAHDAPCAQQLVDQSPEELTSELQSLMSSSYAVFCLKKKMKNYKELTRKHQYQ